MGRSVWGGVCGERVAGRGWIGSAATAVHSSAHSEVSGVSTETTPCLTLQARDVRARLQRPLPLASHCTAGAQQPQRRDGWQCVQRAPIAACLPLLVLSSTPLPLSCVRRCRWPEPFCLSRAAIVQPNTRSEKGQNGWRLASFIGAGRCSAAADATAWSAHAEGGCWRARVADDGCVLIRMRPSLSLSLRHLPPVRPTPPPNSRDPRAPRLSPPRSFALDTASSAVERCDSLANHDEQVSGRRARHAPPSSASQRAE